MSIKWLRMPWSNKITTKIAVQMWEVRWASTKGSIYNIKHVQPELECFTSETTANDFADALRNAFALVKYTGEGSEVSVAKAK